MHHVDAPGNSNVTQVCLQIRQQLSCQCIRKSVCVMHLLGARRQESWLLIVQQFLDTQHDMLPSPLPVQLLFVTQCKAKPQINSRTGHRDTTLYLSFIVNLSKKAYIDI